MPLASRWLRLTERRDCSSEAKAGDESWLPVGSAPKSVGSHRPNDGSAVPAAAAAAAAATAGWTRLTVAVRLARLVTECWLVAVRALR